MMSPNRTMLSKPQSSVSRAPEKGCESKQVKPRGEVTRVTKVTKVTEVTEETKDSHPSPPESQSPQPFTLDNPGPAHRTLETLETLGTRGTLGNERTWGR